MTTPRIVASITRGLSGPGLGEDEFEADLITGSLGLVGDITPASGATPPSGTIPLLWNHNPANVVGVARYFRAGNTLKIRCTLIPKNTTPEGDLARVCAKGDYGVGVSAGFDVVEASPIKGTRGKRYDKFRLLEASLVAVPCDQSARITARAHDADRAARLAKVEEVNRIGRQQRARELANPPAAAPLPSEFCNMSRRERMAHAEALIQRGAPPVTHAPLTLREAEAQSQANHAAAVGALQQEDSRSARILRAARVVAPHGRRIGGLGNL